MMRATARSSIIIKMNLLSGAFLVKSGHSIREAQTPERSVRALQKKTEIETCGIIKVE
jgi:hypothetical protein